MSLAWKTSLGIVLVAAFLLIISLRGLTALQAAGGAEFVQHALVVSRQLEGLLSVPLAAGDVAAVEKVLARQLPVDPLVYVRVHGRRRLLAAVGQEKVLARPFRVDAELAGVDDGVFDLSRPLLAGKREIGRLELGFSTASFEARYRRARIKMVLVSLGGTLLAVLVMLVPVAQWVSRLRRLTAASAKVAAGEFGMQLSVAGRDEVARSLEAFNRMSAELALMCGEMHSQHNTLVELNRDKDRLLQDAEAARHELERQNRLLEREVVRRQLAEEAQKNAYDLLEVRIQERTAALSDSNASLKREIEERKEMEKALAQARDQAEVANRVKGEFLANMSHEIRTPLNAIIGLTSLALNTGLNDKQRQYLDTIKHSGEALLHVINNILDFSKIEAGMLDLEQVEFSLFEVIDHLTEMFTAQADGKHLELQLEVDESVPVMLKGDPGRLGQVLINLMGNAIKFTDAGTITFRVGRLAEADNSTLGLRFTIEDTGCGIDQGKVTALFDAFTQADSSTTRQYGGTGLGLAICRQLVELMDGAIEVRSVVGQGSVFSFTVHLAVVPDPSTAVVHGGQALVVGDTPSVQTLLAGACRRLGLQPQLVADVDTAWQALAAAGERGGLQRLLLVDLDRCGAAGRELPDRVRAAGLPGRLDTVFVASTPPAPEAVSGEGLAWLAKPLRLGRLHEVLQRLLAGESALASSALPGSELAPLSYEVLRGRRVLLAEDDPVNQQVAREMLETVGMVVEVAATGHEVLALLDRRFDVLLMDLQMPEMDGLAATRIIRSQTDSTVPIIAMTAHALKGDREHCLAAGMDDYLAKPIAPEQLFPMLYRWVGPGEGIALPSCPAARQPLAAPAAAETSMDRAEILALLAELEALVRKNSARAEEFFVKMKEKVRLPQLAAEMGNLEKRLSFFDFASAAQLVQVIRNKLQEVRQEGSDG